MASCAALHHAGSEAAAGELTVEASVGLHRLGARPSLQVENLQELLALVLLALLLVLRGQIALRRCRTSIVCSSW